MTSYLTDAGMITIRPIVASKIFNAHRHFAAGTWACGKKKRPDTTPASQRELSANGLNTFIGCGVQTNAIQHTRNTAFAPQQRGHHNTTLASGLSPLMVTSDKTAKNEGKCENRGNGLLLFTGPTACRRSSRREPALIISRKRTQGPQRISVFFAFSRGNKSVNEDQHRRLLRRLHHLLKPPVSRDRRFELGVHVRHRFEEAQQQTALDRVIHWWPSARTSGNAPLAASAAPVWSSRFSVSSEPNKLKLELQHCPAHPPADDARPAICPAAWWPSAKTTLI